MKLWQLRNPKTGENLSDPQPLPENWGPIFGMEGVKDRLGDLSWLGITDQAWFEIEVPDPVVEFDQKAFIDGQIKYFLEQSLPMVAIDNISMTKEQRATWIEYRRLLSEIHLQVGYPKDVYWPPRPE